MKRALLILFLGLAAATMAYSGFYFTAAAKERAALQNDRAPLLWVKSEFKLTNGQFGRVCQLYDAYQMDCARMCAQVAAKNAELKACIARTNCVTPEIEMKMNESAALRAACQKHMMQHFFEVSRVMDPEQGRRYLAWIQEQTILCDPPVTNAGCHQMQ